MKHLRLVPEETNFKFMTLRRWTFPGSMVLIAASIVLFFVLGLNQGIDFQGGTLFHVKNKAGPADLAEIRRNLSTLELGDIQAQNFGNEEEVLIRVERQPGGDEAQEVVEKKVRAMFGDTVTYERVEVVGPRVSGELARAGAIAVFVALFAVLVYIWFRFEWQFALGAIAALVHDVLLTIGMFAIMRLEFNLSSIAAILTIVGYSLNDTVVVYDRIRENLRKFKKMPIADVLDNSVNQTLSRTTLTSVTTLLALIALYILGGEIIRSFTFAMIFGVIVGTYSSIFIAAPVLIFLKLRPGTGDKNVPESAQTA